jgi:SAM-dependent methyltransferase
MEDFSFDPESFDCIVLVAVLEHMKDPRAALNRLHDWLVSGGLLVLVVPYVEWFFRVKQRLPWLPIYFEAPRHLFDFSPTVLRRYLRETAFEQTAMEIGLPGWARSSFHAALIWGVKVPGIVLHWLTGGRYIYPFASSVVAHAVKGTGCRPAAATQPHH